VPQEALPTTNFLDPTTLARIGNLELLARIVVEGFINGLHRSPHLGTSMDFAEHRAYMPGDDIRRIDWRLFARSDRFYLKEYEADTNTNFNIVLDVSKSMSFGTAALSKLDYGRYLAACLAYFSHGQRDRVGLVTFDEDLVEFVPPSAKHLPMVLHTLARATPSRQGHLELPMRKLAEHYRRRCLILIISDFYEEPSKVIEALNYLRNRGNDLMAFHLLDPAELDFPFDDAASFEDMETGEKLPIIGDYMRAQYLKMISGHITHLGRLMAENGIDYTMFNTSKPLDYALFDYLSRREALMRVR
jgi:uncharacterized protein (DUF58 family)